MTNRISASPGQCGDRSTAVPLLEGGGSLAIYGGCGPPLSQRIDIYHVMTDSWRSVDTGIHRTTPTGLMLPTGEVLFLNGDNEEIDQFYYARADTSASGDPRCLTRLSYTWKMPCGCEAAISTPDLCGEPRLSPLFRAFAWLLPCPCAGLWLVLPVLPLPPAPSACLPLISVGRPLSSRP